MYFLFSMLTGVLIAIMIVANGELGSSLGLYSSTAVIHFVGLIFIFMAYLFQKRPQNQTKKLPLYLYLGGFLGVGTIVFNNMAFGKISVSAILALGLLGQSITAIIIDQIDFLQMPKVPFKKQKLIGLAFVFLGIFIMITLKEAQQITAIIVALLTGFTVVMARTFNARLAEENSMMYSTLFNYIIGFLTAALVMLIAGRGEPMFTTFSLPSNPLLYTGGLLGVFTIMLLNITVTKISSFYLTLTLFIGQVFTGIIIDIIITSSFSMNNLIGGIFVALGLSLNVWFDKKANENKNKNPLEIISENA